MRKRRLEHWKIDAVLAHFIGPDDIRVIHAAANECQGDWLYERPKGLDTICARRIHLRFDKRDGVRWIMGSVMLTDEVRYSSKRDQTYCVMGVDGPEGKERIDFEPVVSVLNACPPVSVIEALAGRHVTDIVDHPALRLPELVAERPHINTRNNQPTGFGVFVPQVLVPLRRP